MNLLHGYQIVRSNTNTVKEILKYSWITISFLIVLSGCKKEEELTPQEMLEGKWMITSREILAITTPGDGSYLVFNSCSSSCTGTDYSASDASTGTFTYTIDDDATQIVISDTINEGGNYNSTWDILELTESSFRMTTTTLFGNLKIEMSKD